MVPWALRLVVMCITSFSLTGLPVAVGYFGLTAAEPIITLSLEEEENHTIGPRASNNLHHINNNNFNNLNNHNNNNNNNNHKMDMQKVGVSADGSGNVICKSLKLEPAQRSVCEQWPGVKETLLDAVRLSVLECQMQFLYDRWNCSLSRHRFNIIQKGFKETAFLHAISSASLVHNFARSCAQGRMDRCTCDESMPPRENKETWLWGGCGDNIKYGLKFTRKFMSWTTGSQDLRSTVDRHNSLVGTRVVSEGIKENCKCHGVSGSCQVKTCWRQLSKFHDTGNKLKVKYENAVKVMRSTNEAKGKRKLMKGRRNAKRPYPRKGELVYLERSPNFCSQTDYSAGTQGRICDKKENCDVLCCGRGYNIHTRTLEKPCHCQFNWCCYPFVTCKTCHVTQDVYTCK